MVTREVCNHVACKITNDLLADYEQRDLKSIVAYCNIPILIKRFIETYLSIDNEEEINKLLSTIKSLGNISFIAEKYTFKFNPNLGTNYKISENGLIATKKKQEFDDWDCAILGDTEIPKNEISKWKIKLKYICDYKMNSWSILIGIGPNYDGSKNFHHKCWSFICGECSINNKNKVSRSIMNKTRLKSGSVIEVIVDRPKGNLSFVVNGNNCGIVCNEIPKDVILF